MNLSRVPRHSKLASGFSLIELAIVLMIIGGLMSGVLVGVSQGMANARITNAKAQLREIEEALYGFAQAYGRLPCPAGPGASPPGFEVPIGGPDCDHTHGFIPAATLGISGPVNADNLLVDPWQNPIRYSVASYDFNDDGEATFTDAGEIASLFADPDAGINDFVGGIGTGLLMVCDNPACDNIILTDLAPAVILSMGANWDSYTSANEQGNAGDGTTTLTGDFFTYNVAASDQFVSTTYSEENFDDQIIWLSPYVLFNRLVSAGKLP